MQYMFIIKQLQRNQISSRSMYFSEIISCILIRFVHNYASNVFKWFLFNTKSYNKNSFRSFDYCDVVITFIHLCVRTKIDVLFGSISDSMNMIFIRYLTNFTQYHVMQSSRLIKKEDKKLPHF